MNLTKNVRQKSLAIAPPTIVLNILMLVHGYVATRAHPAHQPYLKTCTSHLHIIWILNAVLTIVTKCMSFDSGLCLWCSGPVQLPSFFWRWCIWRATSGWSTDTRRSKIGDDHLDRPVLMRLISAGRCNWAHRDELTTTWTRPSAHLRDRHRLEFPLAHISKHNTILSKQPPFIIVKQ